jgi:hypothetical protein
MGAPGHQASTDIYDAQVTAEAWSKNELLFLLELASLQNLSQTGIQVQVFKN